MIVERNSLGVWVKIRNTIDFGCIDSAYTQVKDPVENSRDYYNYKQFLLLNIQAICEVLYNV